MASLPLDALILAMLFTKYLVLFSVVYKAQNYQFLFVDVGSNATMMCNFSKHITNNVQSFIWYKREENELIPLSDICKTSGKCNCKSEAQELTLEILNMKVEDTGVYLCGDRSQNYFSLNFANAFSLIVGDSYTSTSWMMILQPPAQNPPFQSIQSGSQLACVVHGVSKWVQISWITSQGLQDRQTLLMKNHSGSLTFVSVLYIPENSSINGEEFICKVKFNSSGTPMNLSTTLYTETRTFHRNDCQHYAIPLAVIGILAFLLLILVWLWIRCCPSRPGVQPKDPTPTALETSQEDICYSHLVFLSNNEDGKKMRQTSQ